MGILFYLVGLSFIGNIINTVQITEQSVRPFQEIFASVPKKKKKKKFMQILAPKNFPKSIKL